MKSFKARKKEVDKVFERIQRKMEIAASFEAVTVDFDFPENFKKIIGSFCEREIEWRKFWISEDRTILSAHNEWKKGAFLKAHYHTQAEELIYIIEGELEVVLYNHRGEAYKTKVLTGNSNVMLIPAGIPHKTTALKESHFVIKFVKN